MEQPISPRLIFEDRMDVLRRQLNHEALSIEDLSAFGRHYEPFADSLRSEILRCLNDVDGLIRIAETTNFVAGSNTVLQVQHRAEALFSEALALKLADSVRRLADNGMCLVGDQLLAELGALVALTLPQLTTVADTEFYGTYSRAIRLRYPANSIWDLSVLAHEFAHAFGPLWAVRNANGITEYPREKFLRTAGLGSLLVCDEYFCDLLATFLMGPAYACTCIISRFAPTPADDTPTHPSDTKRVWWILNGLDHLSDLITDTEDKQLFKRISQDLRELWISYSQLGGNTGFKELDTSHLQAAIERLFGDLKKNLVLAPYANLRRSWAMMADFREHSRSDYSDMSVRDVLNAAWLIRLDDYRSGHALDSAVQEWAVTLLGRIASAH